MTDQLTTTLRNLPHLERAALAHAASRPTTQAPDSTDPMPPSWGALWPVISDIELEMRAEIEDLKHEPYDDPDGDK